MRSVVGQAAASAAKVQRISAAFRPLPHRDWRWCVFASMRAPIFSYPEGDFGPLPAAHRTVSDARAPFPLTTPLAKAELAFRGTEQTLQHGPFVALHHRRWCLGDRPLLGYGAPLLSSRAAAPLCGVLTQGVVAAACVALLLTQQKAGGGEEALVVTLLVGATLVFALFPVALGPRRS